MTATHPSERHPATDATAVSLTLRQTSRRALPWIVLAAIAVAVAVGGIVLTGNRMHSGVSLDAGNAGPTGGKALAQVLSAHGVDVRTASSLQQVRAATTGRDDSTLLLYDDTGNLESSAYDELARLATTVVIVEPSFPVLRTIAPGVEAAGTPDRPADAGCADPAAQRAARIDARATATTDGASVPGTFRVQGDVSACFMNASGAASLVQTTYQGSTVSLVGSAPLLMNGGIDRAGNAALGLNLLGQHRTLVWYLPGIDDRTVTGPPDIAALTPGWVTPTLLLLIIATIAAAVWRGRRFGPLVFENLPVIVRASETREGRARLYQRSSARLRAADALRIGTLGRLASLTGLPRTASATEIADAVAAFTGQNQARTLLIESIPRTDSELIALSDALVALEQATATAIAPTTTIRSEE